MKKTFLALVAFCSTTLAVQAQQEIETYSVYDVNHDGTTQVDDAVLVANGALGRAATENSVVDATTMNALLQSFDQKLESIEARLSTIEANQCSCCNCGNGTSDQPDRNGIRANGHKYVDLGLKDEQGRTIYWATCNVGADKPEDYGDYFAWGDTEPYYQEGHSLDSPCSSWKDGKTGYNWANYKWCNGSYDTMTKYCTTDDYGTVDNKTVLEPEDDAATQNWGGDWRMPTLAEQEQLSNECTWTWDDAEEGYTVTGPNGNTIFLPAAGYRTASEIYLAGSYGLYWSSSLYAYTSITYNACYLKFKSSDVDWRSESRYYGQSVRAVCVSIE